MVKNAADRLEAMALPSGNVSDDRLSLLRTYAGDIFIVISVIKIKF